MKISSPVTPIFVIGAVVLLTSEALTGYDGILLPFGGHHMPHKRNSPSSTFIDTYLYSIPLPMDMQEVDAEVFKALSDANRLKILSMLSSGEICACRILEALDITQPTLSHHMKILSGCGLVTVRKEGQWSYYSLDRARLDQLKEFLGSL